MPFEITPKGKNQDEPAKKEGVFYIFKETPIKATSRKLTNYDQLEGNLKELPPPGEYWHIVSKKISDYYDFIPVTIKLTGKPIDELYASTWIMNQECASNLIELIEKGAIKKCTLLLGEFMVPREPIIYKFLVDNFKRLNQRMCYFYNHAKVLSMKIEDDYYVLVGSANFCQNPRLEQNLFTNSEALFNFNKDWMENEYREHTK